MGEKGLRCAGRDRTSSHWQTAWMLEGRSRSAPTLCRRSATVMSPSKPSRTAVEELFPPAEPASATILFTEEPWYSPMCSAILAPRDLQQALANFNRLHANTEISRPTNQSPENQTTPHHPRTSGSGSSMAVMKLATLSAWNLK